MVWLVIKTLDTRHHNTGMTLFPSLEYLDHSMVDGNEGTYGGEVNMDDDLVFWGGKGEDVYGGQDTGM